MDDAEVERQIDQMVRFIRQEAEEKAAEIGVSAEEEFNIEKLTLLDAEKARLGREFSRREAAVAVKRKVDRSKAVNEARLRVLRAQEDALAGVVAAAGGAAAGVAANAERYAALLADLIAQAAAKLGEPDLVVVGRREDAALLPGAAGAAAEKLAARGARAPALRVADDEFLPPPPGKGEAGGCAGGVVVRTPDGRIRCANTLDARLATAYAQNLPAVRAALFGGGA